MGGLRRWEIGTARPDFLFYDFAQCKIMVSGTIHHFDIAFHQNRHSKTRMAARFSVRTRPIYKLFLYIIYIGGKLLFSFLPFRLSKTFESPVSDIVFFKNGI